VTGFLGKLVLENLLRRREELGIERIHVVVRSRGGSATAARFRRIVARAPCFAALPAGWTGRVSVAEGDLAEPGCGLAPEVSRALEREVSHVVHAAATVEFDLPLAEASAANVTATLEVLELARRCERLESFVDVSTAYATPHPGDGVAIPEELPPLPGPAPELYAAIRGGRAAQDELLARSGHPNTYTFTKALSEHLLGERRAGVPLAILRPSIISATWRRPFPGWIDSSAAFAGFVAMIGAGHLKAVVGDPRTRLNLVPADWVAERAVDVGREPTGGALRIHHAVAAESHTPDLRECGEAIVAFFRQNPVGRRPAVVYLGPPGLRFRLADGLRNRAPVQLAMLLSSRQRSRGRRLLSQLESLNQIFRYFTRNSFAFDASRPFDLAGFGRVDYLTTVCAGVARHLLRARPADPARPAPQAAWR
jgi:nucleoside-diphosphate-sugar epimerase